MEPAKQAKIVREFQKQSTQMDMTVIFVFQFRKLWTDSLFLIIIDCNSAFKTNNLNKIKFIRSQSLQGGTVANKSVMD